MIGSRAPTKLLPWRPIQEHFLCHAYYASPCCVIWGQSNQYMQVNLLDRGPVPPAWPTSIARCACAAQHILQLQIKYGQAGALETACDAITAKH